jgi:hypothetical protein
MELMVLTPCHRYRGNVVDLALRSACSGKVPSPTLASLAWMALIKSIDQFALGRPLVRAIMGALYYLKS